MRRSIKLIIILKNYYQNGKKLKLGQREVKMDSFLNLLIFIYSTSLIKIRSILNHSIWRIYGINKKEALSLYALKTRCCLYSKSHALWSTSRLSSGNRESYRKFTEWLYKKVVHYKKHRKKIESEHFPYDTILPERLYKMWQKKYGWNKRLTCKVNLFYDISKIIRSDFSRSIKMINEGCCITTPCLAESSLRAICASPARHDPSPRNQVSPMLGGMKRISFNGRGTLPGAPPELRHGRLPLGPSTLINWTVVYNEANRAVSFTSQEGSIVVECGYDYQGCRYRKKVTENGMVTSYERYL